MLQVFSIVHKEGYCTLTGRTSVFTSSYHMGVFKLFFSAAVIEYIVNEMNRYARECMGDDAFAKWVPVTAAEIEAYLGFIILMGINRLPALRDYWHCDQCIKSLTASPEIETVHPGMSHATVALISKLERGEKKIQRPQVINCMK